MKKIITILLAASIAATLISCSYSSNKEDENKNDKVQQEQLNGENDEADENGNKNEDNIVFENVDLIAVADSLYDGLAEDAKPMVMTMPIEDAETFKHFTFVDYEEGLEAVANEPMMSSIAHSIVLVKCPTVEKAKEIALLMKENCDPRKWMCVEADIVEGVTNGNIAMLLMTTTEGGMSETILSNFASLDEQRVSELKSEVVENEMEDAEDVNETEKEPVTETIVVPDDEVVTYPDADEGVNVPATMPEENNTLEVVPEIEIPSVETEQETEQETEKPSDNVTIDTLYYIADSLYNGIDPENMPMVGTIELTEENFEYSAFVPYNSSYLAVESMPMMGSNPHSVVIVKTNSPEEASSLASAMKANADPRKWICVNARSVKSASKGDFAILVMTGVDVMPGEDIDEAKAEKMSQEQSEERANIIIDNFLASVK